MNLDTLKTTMKIMKKSADRLKRDLLQVTTGTVVGETGDSYRPYKVQRTGYPSACPVIGVKATGKYNIGDFVKLDFEDGDRNKPVISGLYGSVQEEATSVDVEPIKAGDTSLWISETSQIIIQRDGQTYKTIGQSLGLTAGVWAMAIDFYGDLLIADPGTSTILKIDKDGGELYDFLDTFSDGEPVYTQGIAVLTNGNIYITGYDTNKLYIYSKTFVSIGEIDISSTAPSPEGIAINETLGEIYICSSDVATPSVQVYNLSGVWQRELIGGGAINGAEGITVDSTGNIYVAEHHQYIRKLNSSGAILKTYSNPAMFCINLSFDKTNNILYHAEGGIIRKLDSDLNEIGTITGITGSYMALSYTGF